MKEGIHPDYHEITVVMTDGTQFKTRSTLGKPGEVLKLDVDPKTHPAWVGGVSLRKTGQMEKFSKKFAMLGGGAGEQKPAAPAKAAAPEEGQAPAAEPAKAEAKPAKKAAK